MSVLKIDILSSRLRPNWEKRQHSIIQIGRKENILLSQNDTFDLGVIGTVITGKQHFQQYNLYKESRKRFI